MPVASPRRRTLVERGLLLLGLARVSHSLSVSACVLSFFLLAFDLGPALSPSWHPDFPSMDAEDVNTIIEDVTRDAAAQAEKIAA